MRTAVRTAFVMTALSALIAGAPLAAGHGDPPLGGPPVKDRDVPGAGSPFDAGMPGEPGKRLRHIPPRVFFGAVRTLASEDAPAEVRLSNEQREQVMAVVGEFREEMQKFREANKGRLADLERRAGLPDEGDPPRRNKRGGGARGEKAPPDQPVPSAGDRPAPPAPPTADQRAAREELRNLMLQGPNPGDYYARVWELLRDDQQAYVRERIEAAQHDRLMQHAEPVVRDVVRRRIAERDARLKEFQGLTPEQVRERLRDLPLEERRRVLRDLRESRQRE